jgi:hypothetical protein
MDPVARPRDAFPSLDKAAHSRRSQVRLEQIKAAPCNIAALFSEGKNVCLDRLGG